MFIGPVLRTLLDILILFTVFPLLVIILLVCIAYGEVQYFLMHTIPFSLRWWWEDIKDWFANNGLKNGDQVFR
jgi:hypothetical protein